MEPRSIRAHFTREIVAYVFLPCPAQPPPTPFRFSPSQDKRAEIKKANPTFGIGEIGKEGGARWQILKTKGDKDKDWKKYADMAAKDKKRYEADKAKAEKAAK